MSRLFILAITALPLIAAKPAISVPEPPTWVLPLTAVALFLLRPRKPR